MEIIRTGNHHKNGTSRVSEAIEKIDCTHVILLQGDEPLLLPEHVNNLMTAISKPFRERLECYWRDQQH